MVRSLAIPINSFAKTPISTVRVNADPACGALWGKASGFNFAGPAGDKGGPNTQDQGVNTNPDKDEYVYRIGKECLLMFDHSKLIGYRAAEPWTFYCGTHVEKSEKRKKNGSVIEVTPIETTVYQYVTWGNAKHLFQWPAGDGESVVDSVQRRVDHLGFPLMVSATYEKDAPDVTNLGGC